MINLHVTLTPFRNESRALKETGSLVRHGIAERIIIAALYDDGLPEYEDLDCSRSIWRVKLRSRSWPKNLFIQLLKYLEFCWLVSSYARRHKIKMVNVHSIGLLPLGVWLKFMLNAKLIYDTHELETETNGTIGFKKFAIRFIEHLLIRFVNLTIVVGWEIERWYRQRYRINEIVTILNCPVYQKISKNRILRDEFNIDDHQKIVLYQGGLSKGRGVELLLKAFEDTDKDKYAIIFMGYGKLEEQIKKAEIRCKRIHYKPSVPPGEVLRFTASADVGISPIEDSCLSYHYCLPNKLFENIMSGVPVVVSNLPEMRKIVESYQIGAVMQHWDKESIFRALHDIESMDFEEINQKLKHAAKLLSWETQEKYMMQAYKKYIFCKMD